MEIRLDMFAQDIGEYIWSCGCMERQAYSHSFSSPMECIVTVAILAMIDE